jgi:hypothetical protein
MHLAWELGTELRKFVPLGSDLSMNVAKLVACHVIFADTFGKAWTLESGLAGRAAAGGRTQNLVRSVQHGLRVALTMLGETR